MCICSLPNPEEPYVSDIFNFVSSEISFQSAVSFLCFLNY